MASVPLSYTLNLQEHPGRDDRMYFDKPGKPVAFLQCGPKVSLYPVFGGTACLRLQFPPAGLRSPGLSRHLASHAWCAWERTANIQSLDVTSMLKSSCFLPYKSKTKNPTLFWLLRIFHTKISEEKLRCFASLYLLWIKFFSGHCYERFFFWVEPPISFF